jgi:hypothetical protein
MLGHHSAPTSETKITWLPVTSMRGRVCDWPNPSANAFKASSIDPETDPGTSTAQSASVRN